MYIQRVRLVIVAMETQQCDSLYITELQVTVNNIKLLTLAQKCVHSEFMAPGTIKRT